MFAKPALSPPHLCRQQNEAYQLTPSEIECENPTTEDLKTILKPETPSNQAYAGSP